MYQLICCYKFWFCHLWHAWHLQFEGQRPTSTTTRFATHNTKSLIAATLGGICKDSQALTIHHAHIHIITASVLLQSKWRLASHHHQIQRVVWSLWLTVFEANSCCKGPAQRTLEIKIGSLGLTSSGSVVKYMRAPYPNQGVRSQLMPPTSALPIIPPCIHLAHHHKLYNLSPSNSSHSLLLNRIALQPVVTKSGFKFRVHWRSTAHFITELLRAATSAQLAHVALAVASHLWPVSGCLPSRNTKSKKPNAVVCCWEISTAIS